jgi:hypothetical protein
MKINLHLQCKKKGLRTYNQGWRRPKWMALRGSNAKIQTQAVMGGEGTRSVTKEPRVL